MTSDNTPLPPRDRGVSANVNYVISLAIMAMLMSGLALSAGNFIENERNKVITAQLEVIGERLASDIANVDQLARQAGSGTTLETTADAPDEVVSRSYTISVESSARGPNFYRLNLVASTVNASVTFYSLTDVRLVTIPGGPTRVTYTSGEIVIEDG